MTEYVSILKIQVRHGYYQGGTCGDMSFAPDQDTDLLIRGYRLRAKYATGELQLIASVVNGAPLVPFPATSLRFVWNLKSHNHRFSQITALPVKDSNGSYSITDQDTSVTVYAFKEFGGLYEGDVPTRPVLANIKGVIRKDVDPRPGPEVFASLTVHLTPKKTTAPLLTLQFQAKKLIWRYFIVSDASIAFKAHLRMAIRGDPFVFKNVLKASASSGLELRIWDQISSQYSGKSIYLLRSDVPIPFSERTDFDLIMEQADISSATDWDPVLKDFQFPDPHTHGVHIVLHPTTS